jgi:hypothetical protein
LILASAKSWLANRVEAGAVGIALLPVSFRAADVSRLHLAAFDHDREARRWLDRMLDLGLAKRTELRGVYEGSMVPPRPTVYAQPFPS